jgi:hypothetical protein
VSPASETRTDTRTDLYPEPVAQIDVRRILPLHLTWVLGLILTYLTAQMLGLDRLGQDSHAYWAVWQGDWHTDMYDIAPAQLDAFNYSPAFALLGWPLAHLPWPAFAAAWTVLCVASLVWLLRPLGWRWVPPLLLCASPEILTGNIFWALALAAVVGTVGASPLRGSAWAFVALTKLTPALGPVWYLGRRQWGRLAASVLCTVLVVGVTYLVVPDLWHQWLRFLWDHEASDERVGPTLFPPLAYRLPVALAVIVWGALTNRRWTIPVAMVLATPVTGIAAFVMLAAIPRLHLDPSARPDQSAARGERAVTRS